MKNEFKSQVTPEMAEAIRSEVSVEPIAASSYVAEDLTNQITAGYVGIREGKR